MDSDSIDKSILLVTITLDCHTCHYSLQIKSVSIIGQICGASASCRGGHQKPLSLVELVDATCHVPNAREHEEEPETTSRKGGDSHVFIFHSVHTKRVNTVQVLLVHEFLCLP